MLGVRYETERIAPGDTGELYAAAQEDGINVPASEIEEVEFTIQTASGEVEGPFQGEVLEDGRAYYRWSETEETGEYAALAQFTFSGGELTSAGQKFSVLVNFSVEDPLNRKPKNADEEIVEAVWARLEDSFDSVYGGPWLREETQNKFGKNKILAFIPEALTEINVQMPLTNLGVMDFTSEEIQPILVKGVLCRVIMHLYRSYVEQPIPQNSQVTYEDRTRYKEAWKAAYDSEYENFMLTTRLWKRGFLQLGHSRMLIGSKAGRLFPFSNFRLQNVGRGWY